MTVDKLPLTQRKLLAKNLRNFLEPDGAFNSEPSSDLISEHIVHKFIRSDEFSDLEIEGLSDIVEILSSNYTDKTINRLLKHIKPSVVLDCSITNLDETDLRKLFYQNDKTNLITSLTFEELLQLAQKENVHNGVYNAQRLVVSILSDTNSEFCTSVMMKKEGYVDNSLLDFCLRHNYSLYTCDQIMGLRAKSRDIDVTIFLVDERETIEYSPNPAGLPMILSKDLIDSSVTIDDIVNQAQILKGGKFIITSSFIHALEAYKANVTSQSDKIRIRKYIRFLASDSNNTYTRCVREEAADRIHLGNLAKKYNAIIFTSNLYYSFYFKSVGVAYGLSISTDDYNTLCSLREPKTFSVAKSKNESPLNIEAISSVSDVSNASNNENDSEIDSSKYVCLPHYMPQGNFISLKKMNLNEKIWILNSSGEEIFSKTDKTERRKPIQPGDFVVYGVNELNDSFRITLYEVKAYGTSSLTGVIKEEVTFQKDTVNQVSKSLRSFANRLALLT